MRKGLKQQQTTNNKVYSPRQSERRQDSHWAYTSLEILAHHYFLRQELVCSSGLGQLYDCGSIWFPITLFTQDVKNFQIILTPAVSWAVLWMQIFFFLNEKGIWIQWKLFEVQCKCFSCIISLILEQSISSVAKPKIRNAVYRSNRFLNYFLIQHVTTAMGCKLLRKQEL